MVYDVKAKIVRNEKISPSVYYLELDIPKIAGRFSPGQFLHMRIGTGVDPLLRRPFSVNRIIKRQNKIFVGIIYKIVGKGTKILKETRAGERFDVLGPLGNGFNLKAAEKANQPVILVGGGMGIAPLFFLAKVLAKRTKPAVFIGTDTKKELVCRQDFKKLGCRVMISTDDGSCGFKGYVSELLQKYLSKPHPLNPNPYLYACGPLPMLKALKKISRKYNLDGQVSVDEMMGCGVGACLGCVIKVNCNGKMVNKRICKDGPVFGINEIV